MNSRQKRFFLKERHPTKDFFIADIFDNLPFKDDIASMEHPIFSLSKKKDIRNLEYKNGNIKIEIKPTTDGLPTIFDKDVLLYCGSLLMNEINQNQDDPNYTPPKKLRISTHDLLVSTNRRTDGDSYLRLKAALDRLQGVSIKTNIKTNKREITSAFGIIESYEIIESSRIKDRMIRLEITLSDWFYNSIVGKEVLTINRDYFRLGKPLERRLYEIARKHCGNKSEWQIGLDKLYAKSASCSPFRKFRFFVRELIKSNHIPDYTISLSDNDIVSFGWRHFSNKISDDLPYIKQETIAKGQRLVDESGTGWDYNEIRSQFAHQLIKGFTPEKVDGAFINFVKKKITKTP